MIKIHKNPDKDFVILNLTDFNMDENDWGNEETVSFLNNTIDELVKRVKPDLITFSGDFAHSEVPELYIKSREVFERIGIPWTFVFGNHDNQSGPETSSLLADMLSEDKNCLFEKGDPEMGVGNFVIEILENDKPIHALVMMDSHDREDIADEKGETKKVWGRLYKNQLEWYKSTVLEMGIKTTLITHIPPYVYKDAFKAAFNKEKDPKAVSFEESFDGSNWNDGYKSSFGVAHEGVCSYPLDCGEFQYIRDSKYTELVLVGHDHVNNFVIEYDGVKLAYATKTGSGCYYEKELNGGTVLTINKDGVKIRHEIVG
ncbi:MAG: metallophosphoesterase [Bacilli bacterium]|nr:metallophosphoesterase [Bacilli bacterium]